MRLLPACFIAAIIPGLAMAEQPPDDPANAAQIAVAGQLGSAWATSFSEAARLKAQVVSLMQQLNDAQTAATKCSPGPPRALSDTLERPGGAKAAPPPLAPPRPAPVTGEAPPAAPTPPRTTP